MTYSLDLRQRAVAFMESGGSQVEASRLFGVTTRTLYNWIHRDNLKPAAHGERQRKLDKTALRAHVRDYPDALLKERAAHFGVDPAAVCRMLKKMGIVKKNDPLR